MKINFIRLWCATFLFCSATGGSIAAAQDPQPQAPPPATLPPQGCPIPLRVTLTFISNQPPSGSNRGSNKWKVDWEVAGQLPGGINAIVSFKITVTDLAASARTATIKVTDAALATNQPEIQEVRLNAVTEVKLFGTGRS